MKAIPYISFNGNCEEAIKFYQSILGGEVFIMHFKDLPPTENFPVSEAIKDKVMHSALTFEDGNVIYFSDTTEDMPIQMGNYATIHLNVEKEETVYDFVEKLSDGGQIFMPAAKVFWGSVFGSLSDKFGIKWSVEYTLPSE